ncbi:MAG: hypothetical protein PHT92_07845 [Bacteroidales bacterium]|nr:hypothetical protein [Bacteroidales bacterium]
MEAIAWVGFSQGLFAAIIMLGKRNPSVPDRLLTAWFTLLALSF